MDGYLKQSTASQARLIGPFVDDTDFKTAETGLTIANTDIKLRANGTTLSNKNSGGGTHQANGMYSVSWDATDTANVGELKYSVVVSGALQVFGSYVVLEEAVYDELFGASALGYIANAPVQLADGVAHGGTLGSSTATLALSRLSVVSQSANTNAVTATGNGTGHGIAATSGSGATGNGLTLLAASTNGHGLKSTGTGTGDGAELTAGASGADLDADITGAITGSITGNLSGSVGSVTAQVTANVAQISGDTTAADNAESFFDGTGYAGTNNVIPTVTTLTGHTAQTGDAYAIVNSGTHGNAALKTLIDAVDDFVDTEIADILTDTSTTLDDLVDDLESRLTAALAAKLTAHSLAILTGTVDAGATTTAVPFKTINGAAASGTNDFYNGAVIVFTSGALLGQRTSIDDYTGASKTATVPALTGAPAEDVTFIIA